MNTLIATGILLLALVAIRISNKSGLPASYSFWAWELPLLLEVGTLMTTTWLIKSPPCP